MLLTPCFHEKMNSDFCYYVLTNSLLLMPNRSADTTFVLGILNFFDILKSETLLHKLADLSIPKIFLVSSSLSFFSTKFREFRNLLVFFVKKCAEQLITSYEKRGKTISVRIQILKLTGRLLDIGCCT